MNTWPENVGIIAMELIFPSLYVDQTQLEEFDGVSSGKYTIGLGQQRMGFCSDLEDINSFCLTVVQKLIENYKINLHDIGRLEVGTETIIDKSKSVKSVLMQLFEKEECYDVEGVDTTNACYGGTAALFNAISWIESSAWDGRYALVVAADIAVYAKGSARPTGGAGAVAMLIGPNAPLVIDRGLRASYMRHAYDFYKPDLTSEYPFVDGKLSIQCYLSALDNCYNLYKKKQRKKELIRDVEKAFINYSNKIFEEKTKPSLFIASQVGNMYTPSIYGGLVSLLISKNISEIAGNKIALFSYGSGLASSMFSITISNDYSDNSSLHKLVSNLSPTKSLLAKRICIVPEKFSSMLDLREANCHKAPYEPVGDVKQLFPGTYYLTKVDDMHRRSYLRYFGTIINGNS
ncbi:3-hydroxy-3-methylglutaryl coenzyme a synthase [Holotrichia oblita]|uniref:3-hydroxy-3-methylglutaryl coenzyme a synthase n=1 Tax=Holotrichia oblita TaxID=644536 RepID=A0ACB9TM82_HOLOL|nr:3-hydroxy-3-methylglutaryl coenzyme a synthase [Holotrichia oblita]